MVEIPKNKSFSSTYETIDTICYHYMFTPAATFLARNFFKTQCKIGRKENIYLFNFVVNDGLFN